ncbi:MAG: hypothetical protein ACE5OZ_15040 [Candidatus Heimdallarchaeota archaeon]
MKIFLDSGVYIGAAIKGDLFHFPSKNVLDFLKKGSGHQVCYTQKVVNEFERKLKKIANFVRNIARNLYFFLKKKLPTKYLSPTDWPLVDKFFAIELSKQRKLEKKNVTTAFEYARRVRTLETEFMNFLAKKMDDQGSNDVSLTHIWDFARGIAKRSIKLVDSLELDILPSIRANKISGGRVSPEVFSKLRKIVYNMDDVIILGNFVDHLTFSKEIGLFVTNDIGDIVSEREKLEKTFSSLYITRPAFFRARLEAMANI